MNTDLKDIIKILGIATGIIIIAIYSFWVSKDFISGPDIVINHPQNGSTVENSMVEINGQARHVSYIALNNRQIFTDEQGNFKEKILLFPGYNVMELKVHDRFNRQVTKTLELMLK